MLYLFGSGSYVNDRKILKVGYTDDIKERKGQYLLHNPLGKFVSTRHGDRKLELKLHLRLTDYKVEFLDEWFYDEPGVIDIFEDGENIINEWLWENKGTIFYPLPEQGSLKREILTELSSLFGDGEIEGTKII